VLNRGRVERVWLAHPLRYEPLLTRFSYDPVVGPTLVLLPRRHDHPLSMQRMIGILNNNHFLDVMMGSMKCRRSAALSGC
jgi:hypothetical protein